MDIIPFWWIAIKFPSVTFSLGSPNSICSAENDCVYQIKDHGGKSLSILKGNDQHQKVSAELRLQLEQSLCGHGPSHLPHQLALILSILEVIWPASLVGHFPSVDLTSNRAAQISPEPQTETLSSRHNNSHTRTHRPKPDGEGSSLFAYFNSSSLKTSAFDLFLLYFSKTWSSVTWVLLNHLFN